jgi:hypothetical protein
MAVDHDALEDPLVSILIRRARRLSGHRTGHKAKIMSTAHRIDVHQHVVPPFWAKELPAHGGDPSGPRSGDPSNTILPQWSPESAIDFMDSQEISVGMLSLTPPGIVGWYKHQRRKMARRVNPVLWAPVTLAAA